MTDQAREEMAAAVARVRRWGPTWLGHPVTWIMIAAILVVIGLAAALFVSAGGVDVSADKPDGWVARHLLHYVFNRSEAARAHELTVPNDLASPSRVRLGAQHFDMVCANCHGRPGFGQSVVALSMSPRPQYLPKVLYQFSDGQLYQIVEHGVKFSAMPSWATDGRGDEVWSMVAFLRQLPRMDAKTYRDLTALPPVSASAQAGIGDTWTLRRADTILDTPPANEFLYASPASGFSDSSIHDNPAATCARCHGADGSGAATGGEAPNLTLQDATYLQRSLEAYARGSRKSGFMRTIAAQLSDAQMATLARYYAGLTVQTVNLPPANPALIKRGETIATMGIRERAIPACANCHESVGATITNAPHIAGQSVTYLRRQLTAMAAGGRGSTLWWNPMPAVAHDLGATDTAAVAAYYASLKPVKAIGAPATMGATAISWTATPAGLSAAKSIFATGCTKCHVNGGRGDLEGNYPDLTLQSAPYVAQTLYAFRTRERPNQQMREIIDSLTFDQMTNLAVYINGLTPQPALAKPNAALGQQAAMIATQGIPARHVPACLSCHGAQGVAALALIPRLQGQNAAYLRHRLERFARPDGADLSALNPMPKIASRLTDKEIVNLAAYFAAAPPLGKSAARP